MSVLVVATERFELSVLVVVLIERFELSAVCWLLLFVVVVF